jgi:DNA-binding transcriptional MerR regulator
MGRRAGPDWSGRALDLGAGSKAYASAMTMTISQLATRAGLTPDTLRYYQKIGLLPPPRRSQAGYRLFDEESLDRLSFIKSAQRVGLKLADIGQLLEVMDNGMCPCGHTERLLHARLAEVDREIARLTALRESMVKTLDSCPADCSDISCWPCGTSSIEC